MSFKSLRKTFLAHKADKGYIWFSIGFVYISKRGDSTNNFKFSKVNILRKKEGRVRPFLFLIERIKLILNFLCVLAVPTALGTLCNISSVLSISPTRV